LPNRRHLAPQRGGARLTWCRVATMLHPMLVDHERLTDPHTGLDFHLTGF
jgi:hypothetical protein